MKLTSHKQLFLIDGIGALVSAAFLGIALVQLESIIGMPVDVLYLLAGLALLFAAYSLSCYILSPSKWRFLIKLIAFVNLCYCLLTLTLVLLHLSNLTTLGIIYFLSEMFIIIVLVRLEWRFAASNQH